MKRWTTKNRFDSCANLYRSDFKRIFQSCFVTWSMKVLYYSLVRVRSIAKNKLNCDSTDQRACHPVSRTNPLLFAIWNNFDISCVSTLKFAADLNLMCLTTINFHQHDFTHTSSCFYDPLEKQWRGIFASFLDCP